MRGVIVRRELSVRSGVLTVRAGDQLVKFRFDARTYVERDNRPIEGAQLQPGEQVEVVSDLLAGATLRSAQSIHVLSPHPVERSRRPAASPPKGDLTFSGLVLRVAGSQLVLRGRDGSEVEIALLPSTQYAANGDLVSAESLKPNMRVEVLAGRDVAGKVVAYQIVWGSMLSPK